METRTKIQRPWLSRGPVLRLSMQVSFAVPVSKGCASPCPFGLQKGKGKMCRGRRAPGSLFCVDHASYQAEIDADGYVHVEVV